LNNTAIGARYKLNTSDLVTQNITIFYNYGVFNTPNYQLLNTYNLTNQLNLPLTHKLLTYFDNIL